MNSQQRNPLCSIMSAVIIALATGCASAPKSTDPGLVTAPVTATTAPAGFISPSMPVGEPSHTPTAEHTTATTTPLLAVRVRILGNLFIRRGPDLAFNAISVLTKGQTVTPNGRDALSDWVRIPLTGNTGRTGWISVMTDFTEVRGEVRSLPEIEPTDWPELAFLRNCTNHEMAILGSGIVLPAAPNFPHNDVRVNPGTYSILDLDVEGYPSVLDVEVREGSSIDILVDGNGEKRKCPSP